jgi:hypothetical protein
MSLEAYVERLEVKTIKGKKYYYHSKWGRREGDHKPRRLWQKYIGTLEDLLSMCGDSEGGTAELYEWGESTALAKECMTCKIIESVDTAVGKWRQNPRKRRAQGLSIGGYIAIAAINRASSTVCSKRSMWQWFSRTAMHRHFPSVSEEVLSSQNFWNNMEKILSNCSENDPFGEQRKRPTQRASNRPIWRLGKFNPHCEQ